MRVDITLLARFEVRVDGRPVPSARWPRRDGAALVKLLALAPGHMLHREQVIDALWPDVPLVVAAPRLHKAAHYARRALGARDGVVLAGNAVRLCPDHDVQVDAVEFERMAVAAADAGVPAAKAVLARFGGPLLPTDPYEPWTEPAREHLGRVRRDLLRQAGDRHELLAMDPADEDAHLALARRHATAGDRAAALRQLDTLATALRRELGVGLSAEALALRARLVAATADDRARLERALACVGLDPTGATDASDAVGIPRSGAVAVAAADSHASCCG